MSDGVESADKALIANNVEKPLAPRQWDAPRFQGGSLWCPPVPLVAGRLYYIEAHVFVRDGEGHVSVAWKRPGAGRELLTGEFLSPINVNE